MNDAHYAVILAGGRGERFWPLSRHHRPKQLLRLVGEQTLLAQAVDRLAGLIPPERVYVVTNQDLVEACRIAAPRVPPEQIIGEPVGRDTAAAAALGAALIKARDPQAAFCILTADHVIGDEDTFRATLRESLALARRAPWLCTIGIPPTEPSTGYGYIEVGDPLEEAGGIVFQRAKRFVEKPDAATAQRYLEAGTFCWNSGMFIWSVSTLEAALRQHCPGLAALIAELTPHVGSPRWELELKRVYERLDKISIDYALMEKADNIVMVRGTFAWDDVGSWPALANHFPADSAGNVVIGDAVTQDAHTNIIYSQGRLTALIGVQDLVVVQAEDATLICPRDQAQQVKKVVEQLKQNERLAPKVL